MSAQPESEKLGGFLEDDGIYIDNSFLFKAQDINVQKLEERMLNTGQREYFKANGVSTCVAGCPKTIDGDLKNEQVEVSFGFDTACKTYSELIGNLMMDTAASRKYYHFIRLMGRSASHITLECALETCPNMTLIGEEEEANNSSLESIVGRICDMIVKRSGS